MILSVFEIVLVSFTVWGIFHEDKFVKFEEKLFGNIKAIRRRRKFRVISSDGSVKKSA